MSRVYTTYWYTFNSAEYEKGFCYKNIKISLEEFASIAHSYAQYDKDFEVLEQTAMGTLEHPVYGKIEYWIFATTGGWELIFKNATHYGYPWNTVYHGASAPITDDERNREVGELLTICKTMRHLSRADGYDEIPYEDIKIN